ncbi:MAG: DUF3592 domain-containing protein [Alphaproteobacteria bacterium]|nr:DUF3592 domain-containing protein [Alphaproteobacteria bacterium]
MPEDAVTKVELTVALAFFILLTVAGLALGGVAVRDFGEARASVSWPRTEGVVLSPGEDGRFRYAYVADGRSYESSRIAFLTSNFLAPAYQKPAPGGAIAVRYDPEDGARAVLRPGGSGGVFAILLGLAALLAFVGLGGLIRTLILGQQIEEENGDTPMFGRAL